MPLCDHYRPLISNHSSWEGFYGGWPSMMVQRLVRVLPDDFTAEPRVHLGAYCEIDICAFEDDEPKRARNQLRRNLPRAAHRGERPIIDAE